MYRLCVHQSPDCETLYHIYWERIVRFCTTRLIACPDGTAEEVAQDVFLAAHCALTAGRYRGDGALSTWLFGIAGNLCAKTHRDTSRKTTLSALRHLERELAQLERTMVYLWHQSSPLDYAQVMGSSFQRLAREDRQAYTLLHMHVVKGASVRELAVWQGISRSTVQRRLAQAKATLHTVYQSCLREAAL